jgi:hypothetical protein
MASDLFMVEQKNSKQTPIGKITNYSMNIFHGDNGAGLGASHQTGWTGLVSVLSKLYGTAATDVLQKGAVGTVFKKLANQ